MPECVRVCACVCVCVLLLASLATMPEHGQTMHCLARRVLLRVLFPWLLPSALFFSGVSALLGDFVFPGTVTNGALSGEMCWVRGFLLRAPVVMFSVPRASDYLPPLLHLSCLHSCRRPASSIPYPPCSAGPLYMCLVPFHSSPASSPFAVCVCVCVRVCVCVLCV